MAAQVEIVPGVEIQLSVEAGDSLYFTIHHSSLARNSHYEIRLSYLGTMGADLSLSWEPCALDSRIGIKMLDTDKLSFTTDDRRYIAGQYCEQYLFRLRSFQVSRNVANEPPKVPFALILESYTGPVPDSTFPLIALLLAFVPVTLLLSFTLLRTK